MVSYKSCMLQLWTIFQCQKSFLRLLFTRNCRKWAGKSGKMGLTYCAQSCPVFISSKNCIKIWPKKNLLRQCRCNALQRGSKSHFSQKNAFFRQKMAFFWKNHFIQNSSVTKNTSYTCSRKNFFLLKLWFSNFHRIQPTYDLCAGVSISRILLQ